VNTPPLVLGAALTFWGWHTGRWWLGLLLGALAELPRVLSWHWELGLRERQRIADLCTVVVVLAGVYLYFTQPRLGAALILLLQWFPLLLFPLLAAQLFGGRSGVELSVLFLSLRGKPESGDPFDLRMPFLLLTLLSAGMLAPDSRTYYPTLVLFAAWSLWPLRPGRRHIWSWGLALTLAAALGHGIAIGLQHTQRHMEDWVVGWMSRWMHGSHDPYRSSTAIGEMGRLDLSERIVLRVRPEHPTGDPLLLRSAAYNRYREGTWLAHHRPFQSLPQTPGGWVVGAFADMARGVEIEMELDEGRGLLPLPSGTRLVRGLEGAQLSRNPYGAVKVLEGPAFARFRAHYAESGQDAPPDETDLRILPADRPAVGRLAGQLDLASLKPKAALTRLQIMFSQDFRYALDLKRPPSGRNPIAHFLLHERAGHCEYFATAAALLLRQAGIPTRYAVGWSVQEYSHLEQAYVARGRHAHAWVLAWIDGRWQDFDPTPPEWGAIEARQRPWWGGIQDLLSRLAYLMSREQDSEENGRRSTLIWLLPPLAALLVWRIARRGRRSKRRNGTAHGSVDASPFAPLDALLSRRGDGRRRGETLREWAQRLSREGRLIGTPLTAAVDLYYRAKFDPAGLGAEESRRLETQLRELTEQCRRNPAPPSRRA